MQGIVLKNISLFFVYVEKINIILHPGGWDVCHEATTSQV